MSWFRQRNIFQLEKEMSCQARKDMEDLEMHVTP